MIKTTTMQNSRPIRFVVFHYQHHSLHSGYSRLAEYGMKQFPAELIYVSKTLPNWLVRNRVYWHLAKGTPGYTRAAMTAELQVAWQMLREKDAIFHFLYGETTYHHTGNLNNHNNNRIVATFHLPPRWIEKSWTIDGPLRQLSAAVCVGTSQQEYLSKIIGHDKIFFCPHGIDQEFYTPPASFSTRDPNLCIIVGENFRDFPTLRGVIELVAYMRPQTRFVAVLPPSSDGLVGKHPNLTIRSQMPEAELLELYRNASLMVLPLIDATANNALLEAMACGLPQVVTDVGSIRDYATDVCVALMPINDARKMAERVVDLLGSPSDLERMSKAAVDQAAKFAWPKVVEQLSSIYSALG